VFSAAVRSPQDAQTKVSLSLARMAREGSEIRATGPRSGLAPRSRRVASVYAFGSGVIGNVNLMRVPSSGALSMSS
jgi:hypothetical protein